MECTCSKEVESNGFLVLFDIPSNHIRLFFPNRNPPAGIPELERHPVMDKLKEAFCAGAKAGNIRFVDSWSIHSMSSNVTTMGVMCKKCFCNFEVTYISSS